MLNDDYRLAAMERQAVIANKGKPLSDAQAGEIKSLHDKIAELDRQLSLKMAALEQAQAELASRRVHAAMVREARAARPRKRASAVGERNRVFPRERGMAALAKLREMGFTPAPGTPKDVLY